VHITAETTSGPVRGESNDHGVVFRAIPYAAPPTGERRFRPPHPPESNSAVRDCTSFAPICPQMQLGEMGGVLAALGSGEPTDEDCLYLNVWTPSLDDRRRPTMVFIHGGAYRGGSGSTPMYDGEAFARDDVVLVTLNYRLHALGFLFLDQDFEGASGTGNLGLLDQIAALRWVRDNIAAFGGDPENVTVFGESAGAMSVGTLLASPAASGLFRRAILQSGAAHHALPAETARRVTHRTLELLGVEPGDWPALQAIPADTIVAVATQVGLLEAQSLLGEDRAFAMPFMPVVDGVTIEQRPIDAVRAGRATDVELLIGTCAEEWRLFIWGLPEALRSSVPPPDIAPFFAGSGRSVDEVLKVYAQTRPDAGELDLLAAVQGDQMFGVPALRLAEAQVANGCRVWMYRFDWRTPVLDGSLGACHALELPFVFDTLASARELVGPDAPEALAVTVHDAWVRFARDGDPGWPTFDVSSRPVNSFGADTVLLHDPEPERRAVWEGVW